MKRMNWLDCRLRRGAEPITHNISKREGQQTISFFNQSINSSLQSMKLFEWREELLIVLSSFNEGRELRCPINSRREEERKRVAPPACGPLSSFRCWTAQPNQSNKLSFFDWMLFIAERERDCWRRIESCSWLRSLSFAEHCGCSRP